MGRFHFQFPIVYSKTKTVKMTNIKTLEKRKTIGKQIKKNREGRGLSQLELAEKMGVSRSTISKIENGEFAFSVDYLIKLSENLEFTIKLYSHVP